MILAIGICNMDYVRQGSVIAAGDYVVQMRNLSKGNTGNLAVGDGIVFQPIGRLVNQDNDRADCTSIDDINKMTAWEG